MRISYSSLELYRACPYLFKYTVIDKYKLPKSKEAVFGTTIHETLRFMFKPNPLFPAFDEIANFFTERWNERCKKTEFKNDDEKNAFLKNGFRALERFYKKNQPWNFNILDLESRFVVPLADPDIGQVHELIGIIDRIDKVDDDNYEIIDYKTARRMPSQEALDKNLQLSLYNLGLIKRWPHLADKKIRLSLYFVQLGEALSTYRDKEALEQTKDEIIATIREIGDRETKNYWPVYDSPLCAMFPYRAVCPMWKHLYQDKKSSLDETKVNEILAEFLALKFQNQGNTARLKELQPALSGYMRSQGLGRLFNDIGYVTRVVKSVPVYDFSRIKLILETAGRWQEALKIDESKLEKIAASLPVDLQAQIKMAILNVRERETVSARRKKFEK